MSAGADGATLESFGLQITNNAPLTTGTYDQFSGGSNYTVSANYNLDTIDVSGIYTAGIQFSTSQPLQIVITSISNTQVAGTFSGEFYRTHATGKDSLLVTNGSFVLPMH